MPEYQKIPLTDEHVRVITDYLRSISVLMPILTKSLKEKQLTPEIITGLLSLEKRTKNMNKITKEMQKDETDQLSN